MITTRTRPEVQVRDIHLLETERAFLVLLVSIKQEKSADVGTGHQRARRANTYCFIVAPVRVLYACEDARFGLYRCGTGLENGGGQGRVSIGSCGHCLSICLTERTTRSRIENYSEQRHADDERFGRVCRNATNRIQTKGLSVDHWPTHKFPRTVSRTSQ